MLFDLKAPVHFVCARIDAGVVKGFNLNILRCTLEVYFFIFIFFDICFDKNDLTAMLYFHRQNYIVFSFHHQWKFYFIRSIEY